MNKTSKNKVKTIELSRDNKKIFEVGLFKNNLNPAGLLFYNAKGFFYAFKLLFKSVYKKVPLSIDEDYFVYESQLLSPILVSFHFSIELMLKALISLKKKKFDKSHNIYELWEKVGQDCPQIMKVLNNENYKKHKLLLEELSNHCISIRYAEGTLAFRHNVDENKKQLQELEECCDALYKILLEAFKT